MNLEYLIILSLSLFTSLKIEACHFYTANKSEIAAEIFSIIEGESFDTF